MTSVSHYFKSQIRTVPRKGWSKIAQKYFPFRKCGAVLQMLRFRGTVFGLGAVERQPVRWGNCAKPVLPAGTVKFSRIFN